MVARTVADKWILFDSHGCKHKNRRGEHPVVLAEFRDVQALARFIVNEQRGRGISGRLQVQPYQAAAGLVLDPLAHVLHHWCTAMGGHTADVSEKRNSKLPCSATGLPRDSEPAPEVQQYSPFFHHAVIWWRGTSLPRVLRDGAEQCSSRSPLPPQDDLVSSDCVPVRVERVEMPQGDLGFGIEGAGGSCGTQVAIAMAMHFRGHLRTTNLQQLIGYSAMAHIGSSWCRGYQWANVTEQLAMFQLGVQPAGQWQFIDNTAEAMVAYLTQH